MYDDNISPVDVQNMKRKMVLFGIALTGFIVVMVFGAGCSEVGEKACEALSGDDRDHCYQNIAKTTGDSSLCDKIEGAGPASKCFAYVANVNGEFSSCASMTEKPWYGNYEAYRREDCILYVARSGNCPDCCQLISNEYRSPATDLNPYMEVTRDTCLEMTQCGKPGELACRQFTGARLAPRGEPGSFYCKTGDTTTKYAEPVNC